MPTVWHERAAVDRGQGAARSGLAAAVSVSLVYRSAGGYELLMLVLYGRHYVDRMRTVAEYVPAGASVLECCCGPGRTSTARLV